MTELLKQAIAGRRLVSLTYDGKERTVEPHLFGEARSGAQWLRAYQVRGESLSGEVPGWKLFRLDKVSGLRVLGETFAKPRPEYSTSDRLIRTVYAQL